ncbi:MAG: hypothetical protein SGI73_07975 [Chloroflexota bacterium]|nr:hypothetical protein [Chloroflexota bacterium]
MRSFPRVSTPIARRIARILTRMLAIFDIAARGDSLDADPAPLQPLELDEAIGGNGRSRRLRSMRC